MPRKKENLLNLFQTYWYLFAPFLRASLARESFTCCASYGRQEARKKGARSTHSKAIKAQVPRAPLVLLLCCASEARKKHARRFQLRPVRCISCYASRRNCFARRKNLVEQAFTSVVRISLFCCAVRTSCALLAYGTCLCILRTRVGSTSFHVMRTN